MRTPFLSFTALAILCAILSACGMPRSGGDIGEGPRSELPQDFGNLYKQNCAGCHGAAGEGGGSIPLADPIYQALVDDGTLRQVISKGRAGSHMPPFAQSAGGTLSDSQIDTLIQGMRQQWAKPVNLGVELPSYKAQNPGDQKHGGQVYAQFCASCHGGPGEKPGKAGAVTARSFLQLIDDQSLRTLVIIGRPEFNAPDWRGDVPGRPMTDQEITDVVAWLSNNRLQPTSAKNRQGGF